MAITSTSFIGGVQSDLIFGADVSTAEELTNVFLNSDGSVAKRLPIMSKSGSGNAWNTFTVATNSYTKKKARAFYWESVAGEFLVEIGYCQGGVAPNDPTGYMAMYPIINGNVNVSLVEYYLFDLQCTFANNPELWMGYATTSNAIYILNPGSINGSRIQAYSVESVNGVHTITGYGSLNGFNIRDFWGVGQEPMERLDAASLTTYTLYYYFNSSWTIKQLETFQAAFPDTFPSIYDIPYYGKNNHAMRKLGNDGGGQGLSMAFKEQMGSNAVGASGVAAQLYDMIKNMDLGLPATHTVNSKAPVGMVKIDPFSRARSFGTDSMEGYDWFEYVAAFNAAFGTAISADQFPFQDRDETKQGGGIATHLGRLFCMWNTERYKTIETSPDFNDAIFYSQPLTNVSDAYKMYSVLDPTSEDFVPTAADGGWFIVKRNGQDRALLSSGNILYVCTTKEIKAILSSDQGFTPTNYAIEDIASVGILSPDNIVEIPGGMAFIGRDRNVYAVQGTQIVNLSEGRIQGQLSTSSISETQLHHVRLVYDTVANSITVQIPVGDPLTGVNSRVYGYSTEWVFQIPRKAWTKRTYDWGTIYPVVSPIWSDINEPYEENRTDTPTRSQEIQRSTVSTDYIGWNQGASGTLYLKPQIYNQVLQEFQDLGSFDYPVQVVTNELVGTPTGTRTSSGYITSYFLRTEGDDAVEGEMRYSGATVGVRPDYGTDTPIQMQNAYYYNKRDNLTTIRNKDVVHSKVQLVSNDDNISIEWNGEAGKDFILLGYNLDTTTNVRK